MTTKQTIEILILWLELSDNVSRGLFEQNEGGEETNSVEVHRRLKRC